MYIHDIETIAADVRRETLMAAEHRRLVREALAAGVPTPGPTALVVRRLARAVIEAGRRVTDRPTTAGRIRPEGTTGRAG